MTTSPRHTTLSPPTGPGTADNHTHHAHAQLREAAAAVTAAVGQHRDQTAKYLSQPQPEPRAPEPPATPAPAAAGLRSRITAPSPSPPSFHSAPSSTKTNPPCTPTATASSGRPELTIDPEAAHQDYHPSPLGGNRSRNLQAGTNLTPLKTDSLARPTNYLKQKTSSSNLHPLSRTPSLKAGGAFAFGPHSAASSTVSSPIITAMGDLTPLPSPLLSSDSPGPWRALRPSIREQLDPLHTTSHSVLVTTSGESIDAAISNQSKRRAYAALATEMDGAKKDDSSAFGKPKLQTHTRNRSTSEYIPDPMLIPKRMVTVSGSHAKLSGDQMRREPHLSESRGLMPVEKPPTPPPSESSVAGTDSPMVGSTTSGVKKAPGEIFEACGRRDQKRRRWRALKLLGQGTFSRVMLATSMIAASDTEDTTKEALSPLTGSDRRKLVAVKVCEHGPRGGASADRIEMSLKRELEIMQSIDHPSLVHLKAWNIEPTRAVLILSFCPGGDLFDVASANRDALSPSLLRRMFSELVGAVQYLHERRIVHRDIKLENVLVNLPVDELRSTTTDWAAYPYSIVTLTDLGLSRRIADDEKLETRCGSDDYAAPEVIMGQPYDGRATDAWSLGVLLYALLEGRLPFDPPPGIGDHATQMRLRSRTSHRIARAEWRWIVYGVADNRVGEGDHEADLDKFQAKGLTGAMEVVEGLLKRARSRWPLAKVAENKWVREGIQVEGGIAFHEEEEGEEVI